MGTKDQQHQDQGPWQQKGKGKMDQARERAGQPGQPQRGQRGQQEQPSRGRQDIDDTEMQDRMDHDYDA